jgi:hypothetical protein
MHVDLLPDPFNVEPIQVDSIRREVMPGTAVTVERIRIVVTAERIPIVVIDMEDITMEGTDTADITMEGTDTEGIHIGATEMGDIHIGATGDIHTMVRMFISAGASGWILHGH